MRVKAIAYLAPAFWAFAFLMPVWSNPLAAQDFVSPEAATGRYLQPGGTAKSFMVVAANPLAAEAGAEILKAGGSAIDAAITVQLVLNIVEPQSSGIGGGTFIVHWDQFHNAAKHSKLCVIREGTIYPEQKAWYKTCASNVLVNPT